MEKSLPMEKSLETLGPTLRCIKDSNLFSTFKVSRKF